MKIIKFELSNVYIKKKKNVKNGGEKGIIIINIYCMQICINKMHFYLIFLYIFFKKLFLVVIFNIN